ncbi:LolA family protein [Acinetobacter soli]|uniref:LolA family protein n=1 Tax=Acinetobacter soli TaxID=487316 RepID=UPI00358F6FE6
MSTQHFGHVAHRWHSTVMAVLSALLLGIILFNNAHAASPEVNQIFKQLAQTSTVRADFEQKKKLASLNKTFVSTGQLVFSKNSGVLWQLQRPVQADIVVTPTKLIQKTSKSMSQLDVAKSPYGSVATLFLQLMSGNPAVLDQHFNVTQAKINPQGWSIQMTPKSTLFKKLFSQVDLNGQQFINQIVIVEKGNNSTVLNFSQQRAQPATLTAHENALFQLAK